MSHLPKSVSVAMYNEACAAHAALEAENSALREKLAAAEARTVLTDERAAFEASYIEKIQRQQPPGRPLDAHDVKTFLKRWDDGSYMTANERWLGWQDRAILAASAAPAAQEDAKDAARWRAMLSSARIRMIGSAGLVRPEPNNYAHFGMEIWTKYSRNFNDELLAEMDSATERGRDWMTKYADIAIAANTPKGT